MSPHNFDPTSSFRPRRGRAGAISFLAGLALTVAACGGADTPAPQPAATEAGEAASNDQSQSSSAAATTAFTVETALSLLSAATDIDGAVVGAAPADHKGTIVVVFASWCSNCRHELAMLGGFRFEHPDMRIIGLNAYEDYADRGNETTMRAYVGEYAPWMRVVRATPELLAAFGTPKKVPSVFVYDHESRLVEAYDRGQRPPPDRATLEAVYSKLTN